MTIRKATKKPVTIEFVEWTGVNWNEVRHFVGPGCKLISDQRRVRIPTLEGHIYAKEGDFIIRGVEGEHYPCDAAIFHKTYDILPDEPECIKIVDTVPVADRMIEEGKRTKLINGD